MNNDSGLQFEIQALRTSNRWATLGIILVVLIAAGVLIWTIDAYFGAGGVRIFLIAAGVVAIVGLIYGLGIGVAAIFGAMAMRHHNNVLRGIIDFQRADDYGEVARQVAGGITGVMRSGNTLDSRLLTVADRMARHQLAANQQRQQVDAEAAWYNVPAQFDESEIPAGWRQE